MHWTVWTGRAVGKAFFAFVRFLQQLELKPATFYKAVLYARAVTHGGKRAKLVKLSQHGETGS